MKKHAKKHTSSINEGKDQLIKLLEKRIGKPQSAEQLMFIKYLKSDGNRRITSPKKLRKFLDLVVQEIDKNIARPSQ